VYQAEQDKAKKQDVRSVHMYHKRFLAATIVLLKLKDGPACGCHIG
jgi:hypothetical protein